MASPVSPNDFRELVPAPNTPFCEKFFRKLLRVFPERFYQWVAYERNEDGTLSDAFKAEICAIDCDNIGAPDGGDVLPVTLSTPQSVSATDGDFTDKVRITWAAVDRATSYKVFKNTVNDPATAAEITSTSSLMYDDTMTPQGQVFFYWVKARNATETSAFSNSDSGYAGFVGAGGSVQFLTAGTYMWTVPTGVTTATFRLVGAGGGGGAGGGPINFCTPIPMQGNGGGGGGYSERVFTVVPLNVYVVVVGQGGPAASAANNRGGQGGTSYISDDGVIVIVANGGEGGWPARGQFPPPACTPMTQSAPAAGGGGETANGIAGDGGNGAVGGRPGFPNHINAPVPNGIGGMGRTALTSAPPTFPDNQQFGSAGRDGAVVILF